MTFALPPLLIAPCYQPARTRVKALLLLTVMLLSGPALGAECTLSQNFDVAPLAGITNDRDPSISYLGLMLNGHGNVLGICVQTLPSPRVKEQAKESPAPDVYWLPEIQSESGVVIGKGQGVKAILLRGIIDSVEGKGFLIVKYLANALFMKYRECGIDLKRQSGDQWSLINAYNGQPIKRIRVKTWLLGIATLENVCPKGG